VHEGERETSIISVSSLVCLYVDPFLNLITPFGQIQDLADQGAHHTRISYVVADMMYAVPVHAWYVHACTCWSANNLFVVARQAWCQVNQRQA
jgi:hypothetical protein